MHFTRRQFLAASAAAAALPAAGCVAPHGHSSSYTGQILNTDNPGAVFHWVD
ncbi:MAG: hypothetical protein F4X35_10695, partial [Alphaproteobacteria bacterium]|nr:hypothetical protein [Alphaproteobacteria bacterium]